jgi:uncharacterized membrane protein
MEQQLSKPNMKQSISNLSNMVFGVALSIGALALVNNVAANNTSGSIINSIVIFAFSFIILVYMWFRYTKALELMHVESSTEVSLNIILLLLVAIEPYLFYLLNTSSSQLQNITSILFALDISALLFVLFLFYRIGIHSNKASDKEIKTYYKPTSIALLIGASLYLFSAIPIFGGIDIFAGLSLRSVIWVIALLQGGVLRKISRSMSGANS